MIITDFYTTFIVCFVWSFHVRSVNVLPELPLQKAVLSQLDVKWQQNFVHFLTSKQVKWFFKRQTIRNWFIQKGRSWKKTKEKMSIFQAQLENNVNSPWDQSVVEIQRTIGRWWWPWLFLLSCPVWEKIA